MSDSTRDAAPPPTIDSASQPTLLRHILPVVLGGMIATVLTLVTDNWLGAHGMLPVGGASVPPTGTLLTVVAYRALFATVGCHMAARLAPRGQPRIRYALALGGLMLVVNVIGALSLQGQVPLWYSLSGIALSIPCAILGGGTAVQAMARAGTL
ncbi:MAG TPA: hypothetical protein VM032_09885 [Vicinamibacterales bacterium]|nr:hypothetical protein [Vicinamibacterales bacterium]